MLRIEFKTQEEENSFLAFIKNQKGIDLEIIQEPKELENLKDNTKDLIEVEEVKE